MKKQKKSAALVGLSPPPFASNTDNSAVPSFVPTTKPYRALWGCSCPAVKRNSTLNL
jgi:hypothetical protein